AFGPSVAAQAVPVVGNTGRVEAVNVTVAGLDYITPPRVDIVDPNRRPFPPSIMSHTDGEHPFGGAGPDTVVGNKGVLRSRLNVQQAAQIAGGVGYSGTPTVHFLGGLPPAGKLGLIAPAREGGTDFTLPPTGASVFGCVKSVNIKDPGLGYPTNTQVF